GTRIARIRAAGAVRVTPLRPPSWPCPAISDAIQVPCTPQSLLDGRVVTPVKLGPVITEPDRSLTRGFTPLSMTATVTPAPRVTDQAAGALSMFSTHCSLAWMLSAGAAAADGAGAAASAARPARPAAASRAVPG